MLTLFTFGPAFGLPDPSPFVTKAETLLRIAGIAYQTKRANLRRAPKGKAPYIDDDGVILGDSTFIRFHIEKKYGIDFDKGLSAEQRAIAWAFEKLAEDNLYWAAVHERWADDANFARGPAAFFKAVPGPLRPFVIAMVRRQVNKTLRGQGLGRHSPREIAVIASRGIKSVADYLGDKPYFMGAEVTGVDATMFAFIAGALCPLFDSDIQRAAASHDNLKRYVGRMAARYYPEMKEIAGCAAAA
jgi:glutathione S-transferase